MRKFKRLNVIKETDSDLVANRLIEAGFISIHAPVWGATVPFDTVL